MKTGPKPRTPQQVYDSLFAGITIAGECMIPRKKPMSAGYVQVYVKGFYDYAHRFVYVHTKGSISAGLVVRHTCNNRACINPAHLVVGTHMDNVQDKVNAERQPKGVAHYRSKLTNEDIRAIRAQPFRSYADLSAEYEISRGAIHNIVMRRTWKHIP